MPVGSTSSANEQRFFVEALGHLSSFRFGAFAQALMALGHRCFWRSAFAALRQVPHAESGIRTSSQIYAQPSVALWNAAGGACVKARRWAEALNMMCGLRSAANPQPDAVTLGTCFRAANWVGEWRKASKLMFGMSLSSVEINNAAYVAALGVYGSAAIWQYGLVLLEVARSEGSACDVGVVSAALGGNWEAACQFWCDMAKVGLRPNLITYSNLVAIIAGGKRWVLAFDTLTDITGRALLPNSFSFSVAMSACEKAHYWERALDQLRRMRRSSTETDTVVYNVAVSACEKGKRWRQAVKLIRQARKRCVALDVVTYTAAMSACGKCQQRDEAARVLNDMRRAKLQADAISSSVSLAAVCDTVGIIEVGLVEAVPAHFDKFGCTSAIAACAPTGAWATAMAILTKAHQQGSKICASAYNAMLETCAAARGWQQVVAVLCTTTEPATLSSTKGAKCKETGNGDRVFIPDCLSFSAALVAFEPSPGTSLRDERAAKTSLCILERLTCVAHSGLVQLPRAPSYPLL